MKAFTGTWQLIKLALRRDRIKLPAWIIINSSLVAVSIPAIKDAFPALEDQITYAATVANSVVSRMFEGAVDGPSIGSIISTELFVFMAVLMAFMSTLAVVRHTRQNEETGSGELISSTAVGRYASLTAALAVAIGANIVTGLLIFIALAQSPDLSTQGALGFGVALASVGIAFAGIAALAAQVAESSRGANSLAGTTIGIAYIFRAIGDGFGSVDNTGLGVESMWVSWLSPIGWGQQVFPFTRENWWIFWIFAGFILAITGVVFMVLKRRDVGLGLVPSRKGPARGAKWLLNPFGISWRLQRGVLYGWTIGFVVYGALIGGVAKEFEELIAENEMMQEFIGSANATAEFSDLLFSGFYIYVGAIAVGYVAQALLKMRSEEVKGHLENVASTAVGRMRWMVSHIVWIVLGAALIMFTAGVATGTVHALVSDAGWNEPLRIGLIGLAQLPPILAIAGAIALVYGLRSSWSTIFAWGSFVGVLVITQLGALLRFPQWVMNISPFGHMSNYPVEPLARTPIVVMLIFALVTIVLGLVAFRNRDIETT